MAVYEPLGLDISLHMQLDSEIGIWRVYIEGDRGIKPLYSGLDKKLAQKAYDDTMEGMKQVAADLEAASRVGA